MRITCLAALAAIVVLPACSSDEGPSSSASAGGAGGAGAAGQYAPGSQGGPGAPGSEADLANNVGDRVYFNFNQSQLTPQAMVTLDKQAAWLARYPADSVQVAGNCDERGTEEYNIVLGNRRADADRDYLVAKGIAAARISTISFGKDRPVALGSDEASWTQNRNAITSVR